MASTLSQIKSDTIIVENLDVELGEDEIRQEIFVGCGEISKVVIHYDRNGNSTGNATISFVNSKDALDAYNDFDGATVDGKAMKIKLVGAVNIPKKVVKKSSIEESHPVNSPHHRAPVHSRNMDDRRPRVNYNDRHDNRQQVHHDRHLARNDQHHYDNFERPPRRDRGVPHDSRQSHPRSEYPRSPVRKNQNSSHVNDRDSRILSPRRGAAPLKRQPIESRKPSQKRDTRDNRDQKNTQSNTRNVRGKTVPVKSTSRNTPIKGKSTPAKTSTKGNIKGKTPSTPKRNVAAATVAKGKGKGTKAPVKKSAPKPVVTAADLDREMDAYNAKRERA